jgi:hypothetical protein
MRVRAERPPWYLSVVGGALYVCLFDYNHDFLPAFELGSQLSLLTSNNYFLFHRKHQAGAQALLLIMLVISAKVRYHQRYNILYAEMPLLQIIPCCCWT